MRRRDDRDDRDAGGCSGHSTSYCLRNRRGGAAAGLVPRGVVRESGGRGVDGRVADAGGAGGGGLERVHEAGDAGQVKQRLLRLGEGEVGAGLGAA